MITSRAWRGKRYAVLGLARSGVATVDALLASGANVVAWDASDAARAAVTSLFPGEGRGPVSGRSQLGPGLRRGTVKLADLDTIDFAAFDALVVSPGVPINRHPLAAKARDAGVPIIGDIELFAQARAELPPHKVIGITGTNGKSTTTALIHHILQTAGIPSLMGGNIGLPILGVEPLPEGGVYVLELSSYQIDLTTSLDCDVAVLLNITPDHLDRYDGFDAYAASKARLFAMQAAGDKANAVFSGTDETTSAICNRLNQERHGGVVWVDNSFEEILGVSVFEGEATIYGEKIGNQRDWPSLQGPHNAENAGAAIAVCQLLGLNLPAVAKGLRSFTGLPHRMQRVGERDGVVFVDDSKATNPESVAPALAAFDRIHWVLGGQAKSDDLDACKPHFDRVVHAYTIGEAGPRFVDLLKPFMAVDESGTLDVAVKAAAGAAKAGETVLLSPACASFDQFRDYEDRGDQFRAAVEALA